MPILFEYDKWAFVSDPKQLKESLRELWEKRVFVPTDEDRAEEENDSQYQPFLKVDGNKIRANNYAGFIQHGDEVIEIYPKVFRSLDGAAEQKGMMLKHIFYWFKYCRKWRFPFSQVSLDTIDIEEFPELIIQLIANQFLDTVTKEPLSMYQDREEAMRTPRGSINFKRYINNSLARGNNHIIECDYEPFLYDNKVNQTIKYCTRLLLNQTRFYENQRLLQEVIFVLDEVSDIPCSVSDVEKIALNSFFEDYVLVLDTCKIVLNQQLYGSSSFDLTQWTLLFPMEYIFEDFLAGFLHTHFSKEWDVHYQKSDKYLAETVSGENVFNMQHDIFLTARDNPERRIIVDTKYKLRDTDFKSDIKKGVAQSDLYQMASYALRQGCKDIILVYPNITEEINPADSFVIESGFEGKERINVTAMEVPFWSFEDFGGLDVELKTSMENQLK